MLASELLDHKKVTPTKYFGTNDHDHDNRRGGGGRRGGGEERKKQLQQLEVVYRERNAEKKKNTESKHAQKIRRPTADLLP